MTEEKPEDVNVVRTTAHMLKRIGQYEKAVKGYSKAMDLKSDLRCLVTRSQCSLALGDAAKALADAEQTLYTEKSFHQGMLCKAEALFHRGEFELALVFYHRGKRLRPDIQDFALGIQKASEAIENSVGTPDHVKLTTAGDLTFFYEQIQPTKLLNLKSLSRKANVSATKSVKREFNKSASHRRTVHQLLGQMFHDKDYLEKLLEATDESTDPGKKICQLADDCLKYLEKRTDFWRHQKPMYSRAHDKKVFQRRFGRKEASLSNMDILTKIEKIDEAQSAGKYRRALTWSTQCLNSLNEYCTSQVTNKSVLRGQLNSSMGNAYLELCQYNKALRHHEEDFRISRKFGILEGISRSMDNIGRVHYRQGDYEKAINMWEAKMSLIRCNEEGLWLSQELCRCYLALEKPNEALYYASTSVNSIQPDDNPLWALHGHVLIAQCKAKQKEYFAAMTSYQNALDIAIEMENSAAEASLREAIVDIQKKMRKDSRMKLKQGNFDPDVESQQSTKKTIKSVDQGGTATLQLPQ